MSIPPNQSPDIDYDNLIGNFIGSGSARDVYEVTGKPNLVIKVAKSNQQYGANQKEASYYQQAQTAENQAVLDVIGEVESISQTGKYLIMEHLSDITDDELVPVQVPSDLTDIKRPNYGYDTKGNVKMRDYGQTKVPLSPRPTVPFSI
ncbi:hypothetical protein SL034_005448 [Vibrio harveyi]|nr:hypothetical protein [Vibrio harveyi]